MFYETQVEIKTLKQTTKDGYVDLCIYKYSNQLFVMGYHQWIFFKLVKLAFL